MDFFRNFRNFCGGVYEDFFEWTTPRIIFDVGWMNQVWLFF